MKRNKEKCILCCKFRSLNTFEFFFTFKYNEPAEKDT